MHRAGTRLDYFKAVLVSGRRRTISARTQRFGAVDPCGRSGTKMLAAITPAQAGGARMASHET